jgi:hypothetical protein
MEVGSGGRLMSQGSPPVVAREFEFRVSEYSDCLICLCCGCAYGERSGCAELNEYNGSCVVGQ